MYQNIERCRACGNTDLVTVLDLGIQALTGVFPRRRDEHVNAGPLTLLRCVEDSAGRTCGLVQLKQRYDPSLLYGSNYGYRSGLNRSMVMHLGEIADKIRARTKLGAADIALDIGSNDGTLLKALQAPGLSLVGMDPTGEKFRGHYPADCCLIPEIFSASRFQKEFGGKKAKLITTIAMFYDLDDPVSFMREIAEVLAPDGLWILEQSYLPSMLQSCSYDTICHEHQEYYSLRQIVWMAQRAGLRVVDVELNATNGGSFCVTATLPESPFAANEESICNLLSEETSSGFDRPGGYNAFRERVFRHRDQLSGFLRRLKASGDRVLGYGASTKGNVLLQFCDVTRDELPYIAEVNPDKFGCFTPGTLLPIISEEEAHAMRPDAFFVLPWHFRENLIQRESRFLEAGGTLIFPLPEIDVVSGAKRAGRGA